MYRCADCGFASDNRNYFVKEDGIYVCIDTSSCRDSDDAIEEDMYAEK